MAGAKGRLHSQLFVASAGPATPRLPADTSVRQKLIALSSPAHNTPVLALLSSNRSRLLTRVWGNDIFIQYLRTGEFDWNPLPW